LAVPLGVIPLGGGGSPKNTSKRKDKGVALQGKGVALPNKPNKPKWKKPEIVIKGPTMFDSSCYVFKSTGTGERGASGNCSLITQAIFNNGQKLASQITTRKRARRVWLKNQRITSLPERRGRTQTSIEYEEVQSLLVTVYNKKTKKDKVVCPKLYIAGISVAKLPRSLPPKSIAWSVQEHFQIHYNESGKGCFLKDCFTLLPREWIREVFTDTSVSYRAFLKILNGHKDVGTPEVTIELQYMSWTFLLPTLPLVHHQ
jgi:hypothetical protein